MSALILASIDVYATYTVLSLPPRNDAAMYDYGVMNVIYDIEHS